MNSQTARMISTKQCHSKQALACCAQVKAPGTGVSTQVEVAAGDAGTVVLMLCVDTVAAGAVGVLLVAAMVVTGLAVTVTGAGGEGVVVGVVGMVNCSTLQVSTHVWNSSRSGCGADRHS